MWRVILAAASAICFGTPARADDVAAILRDIKSGQKKLTELEKTIPHVRSKQFHRVNKSSGETHRFDCYRVGGKTLIETADNRICNNESHCFLLKMTSPNTPYSLKRCSSHEREELHRKWTYTLIISQHPLTALDEMQTVPEFLDDPKTKVTRQTRLDGGFIQLSYTWSDTEEATPRLMAGTVVFDPGNNYIAIQHDKTVTSSNSPLPMNYGMTRTLQRVGQDTLTKEFTETYLSDGKIIRLAKNELDYPSTKLADAEFTLEYYGITAPADDVYEDRQFNWPLWVGIGVGLLVISVVLAWVAKRRMRSHSGD